ncbi:thioredoxin domain-containing protein [Flavobacterium capsici]|uniref:Thioredoxin domain-containing protein n=1 Tax=Flavobacterium capsici TaxID=3075618 RepID=A0AA96F2V1_9FLAO|nr:MULTISPECIES: thioredoxin domain-containing protein [unclassified Flavobacterium]WNM18847.1 thioredoxin domain-containing protein [Flavobacterium sp. PMR2A8]WNM22897.1 thioredoxin domain-containing protein [Flavobacterium sp. PMTSA4]
MKSKIFSLLLISFLFINCQGQPKKEVQTVDVKTYSEKLNKIENPQLIDVRTPAEYAVDKINEAKNINWNGDNFISEVEKLDKSKPVFVYCKVGGRSSQAANKLAELGFKEIYNLEGGIMKWNAAGMQKPTSKEYIGITSSDYEKLINSDKKVMVNFSAVWCAPCKKMKPYITKMQEDLKDKIKIVRLDADENKSLLENMKIDGLPVIIVYQNGKETWRNIGFISEEDLKKHL